MHKIRTFWSILLLLVVCTVLSLATPATAQVAISVSFGPPPLPVYEQPLCPDDGYIWTPGYWAWDPDFEDYYWVPGTWVLAPEVGYLWTPPWWGWSDGVYLFHAGFWGPRVGWYGGINYGFGYFGEGFVGGRWDHDRFYYNRAVMNVNVTNIHNVYNETVVRNNVTVNRVSFNGGPGGVSARPRPEDELAARDRHLPPVAAQQQHLDTARGNPQLRANENHGKPTIAATARPTDFRGSGVVAAREAGGEYHPPANRGGPARTENQPNRGGSEPGGNNRTAVHPKELAPIERPAPPNTGNAARDQKYQQQQQKLYAKQEQQRQQLQQKQEQEHQRMQQQNANQARQQQMEQRHQQQTQQLQQQHVQQQQHLQQKQEGKPHGR